MPVVRTLMYAEGKSQMQCQCFARTVEDTIGAIRNDCEAMK